MLLRILKNNIRTGIKLFLIFLFLISFQVITSYFLIQENAINEVNAETEKFAERVKSDFKYENGKWDTTLYNSDPLTPLPNQSGTTPIYVITTDGFVIDRSKPINGFLDTSDYKHLIAFTKHTTLEAASNETWRVLSKQIERDGKVYGVITVAYYQPNESLIKDIDDILSKDVALIDNELKIKDGEVDAGSLDIRNTHFEAAFEVVNRYNKVIINNGRTPTFIDSSYVNEQLNKPDFQNLIDQNTKEEFIISKKTILDEQNNPVGIVIVGRSINTINQLLANYLLFSTLIGLLLTLPLTILSAYFLNREVQSLVKSKEISEKSPLKLTSIEFNKKESYISINGEKIEIPYATNQYYLCAALFGNPSKRWEQDELLEKFGEDPDSFGARKIYDTAIAINKKLEIKLILYKDKTFRINPELLNLISRN
jgi:hypothetical protein